MFGKYKKIIIVLILISGVFIVYSITRPDPISVTNTTISGQNETEVLSLEIIKAINEIQNLTLDKSIFEDPVLKSLRDKSRPIDPIEAGRPNPFEPIPGLENKPVQVEVNVTR